jgi:uncharacterized phage protein (TIGR01671 family)
MRELKFRAWDKVTKQMSPEFHLFGEFTLIGAVHAWQYESGNTDGDALGRLSDLEIMQFTSLHDKNGKEIYEGDIFRIEEDQDATCDRCDGCGWYEGGQTIKTQCENCNGTGVIIGPDLIFYVVIVWVREWAMFATLRAEDEYSAYLNGGVKALDEPMFWTYTLEDTNSRKHFLCGNIFQNPELL